MNRPSARRSAAAIVAILALAISCSRAPDPAGFSVVLVTLDTTRADRIGAFGGTAVPTPNLDRVAREGVRFDTAIAQAPITLPSHATILTGRYPAAHGVRHNGVFKLRDEEFTLTERLKEAGFATAAVVGAYVLNRPYGTAQGFDVYDDIAVDRYRGGHDNLYEAQRTADQVNERVADWLGTRGPGKFFLWVHYYDPHLPYSPPEKPGRVLAGTGYDREISYVDACFGDLIASLRDKGMLERTVLVVVGDHGESLGEHRELSHGVFLYDSAVHVPFLIRAPGLVPRGKTVSGPVELTDLAPTVLDLLGLPPLPEAQGRSLVPRIEAREDGKTSLAYSETQMPRIEFGWSDLAMVRSSRFKYIQAPRPELYDLRDDPKELHNLVADDRERSADMAELVKQWVESTTDAEGVAEARYALSPEEEDRLRSLGYLGGDAFKTGSGNGGPLPDPKDRIDEALLLNEARDLLVAGRAEPALAALDRVLAMSPTNRLARTSRVQALVRLRRLPEAESEARAALAMAAADDAAAPEFVERARRVLASILWMLGKNAEAEREYRLAVELNRANESAPVFGGILLGAAGGREEAMRIVADVLSRNPTDGAAVAAKFELELAGRDETAAMATARTLAELRAGDADTLVKAGKLARERKDPRLAAALFEIANERQGNDADILGYLGTARLAAGDLAGAERALRSAQRLRPDDPRTYFFLGNVALLRGDEAQARKFYAEARRRDPKTTAPQLNLARWLGDNRRFREAESELLAVLARAPDDREAEQLLRRIRELAGGGNDGAR